MRRQQIQQDEEDVLRQARLALQDAEDIGVVESGGESAAIVQEEEI
jgi:hypothetical protein